MWECCCGVWEWCSGVWECCSGVWEWCSGVRVGVMQWVECAVGGVCRGVCVIGCVFQVVEEEQAALEERRRQLRAQVLS